VSRSTQEGKQFGFTGLFEKKTLGINVRPAMWFFSKLLWTMGQSPNNNKTNK